MEAPGPGPGDDPPDPWQEQREALGRFLRSQRQLANLSLRELAELAKVSNPYLSQVERGLHTPSVRVLRSISRALDLSADMVMAQAGLLDDEPEEAARPGGHEDASEGPGGASSGAAGDAGAPARSTESPRGTEAAIRADPRLTLQQKESLLAVYRSYVGPADSR